MIIMGGSAYPREWDYERFRKIADANGSLLMMDMAHISGLVATGEAANPFVYADVVTTTTHKSLRGPRAGMIFFRKDARDFETRINNSVFPGLQGGPHMHQHAGVATQLKEAATPYFKGYCKQVRANASALADQLCAKYGYVLATGGTENHLVLWDLKPTGVTGSKMQTICDNLSITLNKNAVLGDKSALTPGGVRIGSPALTTRGLNEDHFRTVGDFLHKAVVISQRIQEKTGKPLKAFEAAVKEDAEVKALRLEIKTFITQFPMPGFGVAGMKYKELL
jgi:glycine hydroxymethyltransferase